MAAPARSRRRFASPLCSLVADEDPSLCEDRLGRIRTKPASRGKWAAKKVERFSPQDVAFRTIQDWVVIQVMRVSDRAKAERRLTGPDAMVRSLPAGSLDLTCPPSLFGWKRSKKYSGAEVIAADDACDAARSLANLRLLSADVPRCRSRPVIGLRSASASIGASTIGVCLADSIRERRPRILPLDLWRSQKQKARRVAGLVAAVFTEAIAERTRRAVGASRTQMQQGQDSGVLGSQARATPAPAQTPGTRTYRYRCRTSDRLAGQIR